MTFWCLQFLPKNECKKVNLRYHSIKLEFNYSFFEETLAWKNHFDFVWPLIGHTKKDGNHARICFSRTEINFIVINITLIVGRSVTHKKKLLQYTPKSVKLFKGQIFWEVYKNLRNLPDCFEIFLVNVKTMRKIAKILVAFSEKQDFSYSFNYLKRLKVLKRLLRSEDATS